MRNPLIKLLLIPAILSAAPGAVAAQDATSTTPPECGSAPAYAKAGLGGFIHGISFRGGTGSAWDELMGTDPSTLIPVTDRARCAEILAGSPQSTAPLPLLGVVSVGGHGLVVVRGNPPVTADGPSEITYAYLGADLKLRAFHRIKS